MGSVRLTSKANSALHLTAAIRDDGSFHFEYLPAGASYTVTVTDAADGRTNQSSKKFMGIAVPDQEILRKYGTDSTDVMLGNADIDSVRLAVAPTDWTPPAKKAGSSDPADVFNAILGGSNSDTETKPKQ
ncbi:MAG TPA: hypothetical protein VGN16_08900 [Acidobacteriaceae bacterium]|jgi:hypothetical protein